MKKSELKTGMQVELREYGRHVVMLDTPRGDVICNVGSSGWGRLDPYNDDLTHNSMDELDIIAVYSNEYPNWFIFKEMEDDDCIWRREEKTFEIDGVEYSEKTLKNLIKKATE